MTGNKLGRYEILGELGRGAMGVVYRARDPIIDRVVALKTIDLALTGAALTSFEERFFQEARSAGRLNHPNIVTIYDAGKADGVAYIAMEFLEGASLREVLDEQPPLGVARTVETIAQVGRGLAYAHEHGVVHRDIKPANIIILKNRRPKITDFGIARLGEADILAGGERAGSPKYMSPEQIRADATLDGRSDIFSLGTVLYEMLAERPPFAGETVNEIMRQVLDTTPPPPSALNARVPPELDAIVMRMLAKRAGERFPSARSLFRELRRLEENLDEIGLLSSPTPSEPEMPPLAVPTAATSGDKTLVLEATATQQQIPRSRQRMRRAALVAGAAVAIAAGAMIPLRLQFSDANATRRAAVPIEPVVIAVAPEPEPRVEPAVEPPLRAPEMPVEAPPRQPQPAKKVSTPAPRPTKKQRPERPSSAVAAASTERPGVVALASPQSVSVSAPIAKETATVILAVLPWGEIYVDGKLHGTAPPLAALELPRGQHRIEIRNTTQIPHTTYVTLEGGETRRIAHQFAE